MHINIFLWKGLFAFEDCPHIVTYVETTKYVHQTTMQQCFIPKETFFWISSLNYEIMFFLRKTHKNINIDRILASNDWLTLIGVDILRDYYFQGTWITFEYKENMFVLHMTRLQYFYFFLPNKVNCFIKLLLRSI